MLSGRVVMMRCDVFEHLIELDKDGTLVRKATESHPQGKMRVAVEGLTDGCAAQAILSRL
jgi:hypothetical protein